jgi:hypothetical protein
VSLLTKVQRPTRQKEVTKRKLYYKTTRKGLILRIIIRRRKRHFSRAEAILDDRSLRMNYTTRNYSDLWKNKRFARHKELLATLIT